MVEERDKDLLNYETKFDSIEKLIKAKDNQAQRERNEEIGKITYNKSLLKHTEDISLLEAQNKQYQKEIKELIDNLQIKYQYKESNNKKDMKISSLNEEISNLKKDKSF